MFCGAVQADSISSDIVGYNNTEARANLNWYSPCFRTIGYNTTDINDIQLNDGGVGVVGWGDTMQIVGPLGSASEIYYYYDKSVHPSGTATANYWGDAEMNPIDVTLEAGAGFAIDNPNEYEFDISIACPF